MVMLTSAARLGPGPEPGPAAGSCCCRPGRAQDRAGDRRRGLGHGRRCFRPGRGRRRARHRARRCASELAVAGSPAGSGTAGVQPGVAFLEQVEVGLDAEFLQGAGDTSRPQVQGPLLAHAARTPGPHRRAVPGRSARRCRSLPGTAGPARPSGRRPCAAAADSGSSSSTSRCAADRSFPYVTRPRDPGQHHVGFGGVFRGQDPGFFLDDPQMHRMHPAVTKGSQAPRQPGGDRAGVVHLPGRGPGRQVQLAGQLIRGELRRELLVLPFDPGGELRLRGQHIPRGAGFQPAGRGDDPDQLIITQPAPLPDRPGWSRCP